jgi:hypothetical protein
MLYCISPEILVVPIYNVCSKILCPKTKNVLPKIQKVVPYYYASIGVALTGEDENVAIMMLIEITPSTLVNKVHNPFSFPVK